MRYLVQATSLLAVLTTLASAGGMTANGTAAVVEASPAAAEPLAVASPPPLLRGARPALAPAPAAAGLMLWESTAIRTGDFAVLGVHPNIEGAVNVTAAARDVLRASESLVKMAAVGAPPGNESFMEMVAAGGSCESPEKPMNGKCTGCPPRYNGKLCATTTWYEDRTQGSCGCAPTAMQPMVGADFWTLTSFTAALNTASMDPSNPALTYCLKGCGCCYELCTTGGQVNSQLTKPNAQKCQVFKVTNRCADGWSDKRPDWCNNQMSHHECQANPSVCRERGNTNKYGYAAHFDLQDAHRQVQHKLGWINPEVTFEPVSCDRWKGPPDAACPGCSGR